MELDHVFKFVERDGPEFAQLAALGLVETYRRAHPGQGTANACFCFDNMYLELLWMETPADALAPAIARTKLESRSRWRTASTCPFGLAWRAHDRIAVPTWPYTPPYLPKGVAIEVAEDSDDPQQPMMFTFPGSKAPATWDAERKGSLQHAAGFSAVANVTMTLPIGVAMSVALRLIAQSSTPNFNIQYGEQYALDLQFVGAARSAKIRLVA